MLADYTVACGLRDFNGNDFTFNHTGTLLPDTVDNIDQITTGVRYADMDWRPLLKADPMVCIALEGHDVKAAEQMMLFKLGETS